MGVRVFKYRLYKSKSSDRQLARLLAVCCRVWNHTIAIHRRYYRLFKKYPGLYAIQKHLALMIRRNSKSTRGWAAAGSQTIQDIADRVDRAYKYFFAKRRKGVKAAPPRFQKEDTYPSFTLKTSGWSLDCDIRGCAANGPAENAPALKSKKTQGRIRLSCGRGFHPRIYKYHKSREYVGDIAQVTVKRDACGDFWLCLVCRTEDAVPAKPSRGHDAEFCIGGRIFAGGSDGQEFPAPPGYAKYSERLEKERRTYARRMLPVTDLRRYGVFMPASNNAKRTKQECAKLRRKMNWVRTDFHRKTAREMCLYEDGAGAKRPRGKVVIYEICGRGASKSVNGHVNRADCMAPAAFSEILIQTAQKYGTQIIFAKKQGGASVLQDLGDTASVGHSIMAHDAPLRHS